MREQGRRTRQHWWIVAGKVGLSSVFLVLLFKNVSLSEVAEGLRRMSGLHSIPVIVCFGLASLFEVLKLHALVGESIPLGWTAQLVFAGLFFNILLPTSIGGDVVKVIGIGRYYSGLAYAISRVFLDRVIGISVLLISAGLYVSLDSSSPLRALPIGLLRLSERKSVLGVVVVCLGVVVIFVATCRKYVLRIYGRLASALSKAFEKGSGLSGKRLLMSAAGAIAYQALRGSAIYLLLWFMGVRNFDGLDLIPVLAGTALVTMLPVTLGGLGLREGALTALLVLHGASKEAALSVALFNLAVLWLKGLIGAVVVLRWNIRAQ